MRASGHGLKAEQAGRSAPGEKAPLLIPPATTRSLSGIGGMCPSPGVELNSTRTESLASGWRHREPGCGPCGEAAVEVGGAGEAELLQGRRREAGLESFLADQDEALIAAGDGGVPPPARGVAAPFQRVAGHDTL